MPHAPGRPSSHLPPPIGDAVALGRWCEAGHLHYGRLKSTTCPRCEVGEPPAAEPPRWAWCRRGHEVDSRRLKIDGCRLCRRMVQEAHDACVRSPH
jgi:hypothetical protein